MQAPCNNGKKSGHRLGHVTRNIMNHKESKIYVAGHRGLVGSAIWNNLRSKGYTRLIGRTHQELDLLDGSAVRSFFDKEKPEWDRATRLLGKK